MHLIYRETPDRPDITYPVYMCDAGLGVNYEGQETYIFLELTPEDVNTAIKRLMVSVEESDAT